MRTGVRNHERFEHMLKIARDVSLAVGKLTPDRRSQACIVDPSGNARGPATSA
jgi:hypothetical protein